MPETDDTKQSKRREGKLRWVLGWIVLPGTIIAALFLAGVHVGARHPERGLSRLLLKVFRAKPGVAEPKSRSTDEPRPGAKPGEPFEIDGDLLQPKQLQKIAEDKLGLDVEDLSCEDVCRAYAKTKYDVPVYGIENCKLARSGTLAPSSLVCSGKLEAVDKPADAKAD